jgi:ABC-type glycerol-3-phosphate transport system substrate-binding protein
VADGRGNPALFNGEGSEFLFVPADARHPEAALEFARFLVSKENAASMGAQIGVISPLEGAARREDVGPALASALDMIAASEGIFTCRVADLLLEWRSETLEPAFADLLRGDITPETFSKRLDDGVAAARAAGVYVPPYVPYDPTAYGEN